MLEILTAIHTGNTLAECGTRFVGAREEFLWTSGSSDPVFNWDLVESMRAPLTRLRGPHCITPGIRKSSGHSGREGKVLQGLRVWE